MATKKHIKKKKDNKQKRETNNRLEKKRLRDEKHRKTLGENALLL